MGTTVIRGGLVITAADETNADILIEAGRVTALAARDSEVARRWAEPPTASSTPPAST